MNISIKEETLAQRIRLGMPQEELAEALYVEKSIISYYENDKEEMRASGLAEIAKVLQTTPNYLLGFADNNDGFADEALGLLRDVKDQSVRDSFEADHGTDLKKCIAFVRTLTYNMGKRKGRDAMAAKSANLYARIEPDVKEQAEGILATLGIPASNAINMFYKQIILNRGLPFEVKIPTARPVDISRMNAETLDMELEKGYADMQAGRTKSAAQVFADIRRDYNV